ncbi:hypothetical protein LIL_50071 (plasmid) [Leptospira interrogans serovar Linhai str. 56609]|nr:hypothetical protein LIL_50071 [Leptospira interrogans serovar Linhai str. 56609]
MSRKLRRRFTQREIDANHNANYKVHKLSVIASLGERIIAKSSNILIIAIVTFGIVSSISHLAGKQTNAIFDVGFSALIDFAKKSNPIEAVGYIFGVFCIFMELSKRNYGPIILRDSALNLQNARKGSIQID